MGVDVGADADLDAVGVAVGSDPSATGGVGMGVDVGANADPDAVGVAVGSDPGATGVVGTGFGTHPPMAIKSTTHIAVMEIFKGMELILSSLHNVLCNNLEQDVSIGKFRILIVQFIGQ